VGGAQWKEAVTPNGSRATKASKSGGGRGRSHQIRGSWKQFCKASSAMLIITDAAATAATTTAAAAAAVGQTKEEEQITAQKPAVPPTTKTPDECAKGRQIC